LPSYQLIASPRCSPTLRACDSKLPHFRAGGRPGLCNRAETRLALSRESSFDTRYDTRRPFDWSRIGGRSVTLLIAKPRPHGGGDFGLVPRDMRREHMAPGVATRRRNQGRRGSREPIRHVPRRHLRCVVSTQRCLPTVNRAMLAPRGASSHDALAISITVQTGRTSCSAGKWPWKQGQVRFHLDRKSAAKWAVLYNNDNYDRVM
jgi:hypothetical protein